MKRTLLFLLTAAVLSVSSSFAQNAAFRRAPQPSLPAKAQQAPQAVKASAEANQVWWGYATEGGMRSALGTNSTGVVDQAIYISGNNPVVAGNVIKGLRFYLRSTRDISDVKVWLSTVLPTSADRANVLVQPLDIATLTGGDQGQAYSGLLNEVTLNTPYTVTSAGVYVGYSYNVTSTAASSGQYPIVLGYEEGPEGSLYLHTSNIAWGSYASYGPLALSVLVEGQFAQNAATPSSPGEVITLLGGTATVSLPLNNGGKAGISSIDYTITGEGSDGSEQHLDLPSPYNVFGGTTTVSITLPADATVGSRQKTLTITKVNGQPNEVQNASATFTLATLSHAVPRGIAVEEFTGTTCGWCPRGLVGMEKMRHQFPDDFVGIAIHRYTRSTANDAMYISDYTQVSFDGAPSARINRGEEIDPYYGSDYDVFDDYRAAQAIPAKVGLNVSGVWNSDSTKVEATATLEALIEANYRIEYVLIADSLTGNTQPWRQYNYYNPAYGQVSSASELPADLQFLFSTGQYYYPVFNDVAIAVARVAQTTAPGQLAEGEVKTNSYTLSLPTTASLLAALDKQKVYVVALVIDDNGKIANAAKATIGAAQDTGIASVGQNARSGRAATYSLDGRQLGQSRRGIVIERQADGTTRKLIVR